MFKSIIENSGSIKRGREEKSRICHKYKIHKNKLKHIAGNSDVFKAGFTQAKLIESYNNLFIISLKQIYQLKKFLKYATN